MESAQSCHIPAKGQKPNWRDSGWLVRYAFAAAWRLVRARLQFVSLEASEIPARNAAVRTLAAKGSEADQALLERIGYVLPRLSARLPWRSDCLIQAMAGQDWLAANGLAGEIQIGINRDNQSAFEAHAWLVHDQHIVTGGDIEQYDLLLGDTARHERASSGEHAAGS